MPICQFSFQKNVLSEVLYCQYSTGQFILESCFFFFHPVLWAEPSLKGSNTGQGLLQPQSAIINSYFKVH